MQQRHKRFFEYQDHWLSKRPGSDKFYITFYDGRRRHIRRTSSGTTDIEEAKQVLIAFVAEISREDRTAPDMVAIIEVINTYLEEHMSNKPTSECSMYSARLLIDFFDRQHIGLVSDIKPFVIDRFIKERRDKGVSDSTIARNLSVLRAALNYAKRQQLLDYVPHIKSLPKAAPRERWLTPDEARRLINACNEQHHRDYIMIALHTLARPSAVLGLTTNQVDLEQNIINFLPEGKQQSMKRRPVVPISNTLKPILQRCITSSKSGHIIEYYGKPITTNVRKAFKLAATRAGLGNDVIPYTLRHTGATWLAMQGVSMRQIAGMMGHTVQATTEMYAKHHPDFMREATDALDNIFTM